jgi:hypothetical protein
MISCTYGWVEINCSAWSTVHVDELRLIVQRDQLYTCLYSWSLTYYSQPIHVYSWSRWTINLNSSTCTADHAEQLISIVQRDQLYTWMSWDLLVSVISCTRGWVEINCSAWSAIHVDGLRVICAWSAVQVDELRLIVQRDQLYTWMSWD